ncbi:hypothetical protein BSNK01_21810 [Bacillaceae bacterium]
MGDLKRGNLLWEASRMFLPEHKEALLEYRRKQREFRMPELDEDRLAEIDRAVRESLAAGGTVTVTYGAAWGPATFRGTVRKVDPQGRTLTVDDGKRALTLPFGKILAVESEG